MLSTLLLNIILIFLPTQLGLHFWPPFSYIAGFRIDYLSPTIYFIDILLMIYVIVNIKIVIQYISDSKKRLLFLLIVIFLNILFSISPLNTFSWFIHLSLYLLFVLVLKTKKISLGEIIKPLLISTLLIIILEIVQFLHQGSVGGILYWIGERTFNVSTPNIAKMEIYGRTILRPYSTFSHSNSLAGYLLIILLLVEKTKRYHKFKYLIILGILLTLSKSVIITLGMYYLGISNYIILIATLISIIVPLLPFSVTHDTPKYIADRLFYGKLSMQILHKFPIFGVGYGNFISSLPQVLPLKQYSITHFQPAHSLYLLCLIEYGLINITLTTLFIAKYMYRKLNNKNIRFVLLILFVSAFDHYFWTLPQNKIILLISLLYLV